MQNPRLGLGYFWTGILKHTHLNSTPSPKKFLKQSRRSFIQLHQKPGNFLHSAKQYHINPESLQFCRNMHQTKIGQFFKRKPAAGDEAESPDKKVPPPKVLPTKPKVEKNGSSSVKKEKATAAESPPARKRKSRNSDESGSEEEETAKKLKTKPKAENGNKKARRRIVVESSSEEEEDATEAKSDEENGKEEAGSSASTEAGSPSPSPEKKKSPVQEKPKEKSKPAAKSTKAKATPAKKASPAAAKAKKTSPATSKKPAVPVKKEGKASKPEENSDEDAPNKDNDASTDEKSPAPATPVKKPPAVAVAGWDNEYNPGKAKYDPIEDASWQRGQKVPYLALAKTLEAIEATSSRLKNIEILANYFRSVIVLTPNDLVHSVYLCLNKLAPAYEGVELGIAETNIMKAIAQATGRALDRIKADAAAQGDLGLVAESSRSTQKTLFQSPPLTVTGVFHKLKEIASISGNASQGKKVSMITSMLVACKHSEARYLTRSLAGKLRIGLAEQSLLQALAQACFLTPPDQDMSVWPPKVLNAGKKLSPETLKARIDEEAYKLKSCFCECPNYEMLVNAIIKDGTNNLAEHCKLTPGIPPRPMLAQPTKGVADVLERFEGIKFTCEYKYDGERAQVHLLEDGSVRIYSRNQEDNTSKYPDIVSRFQSCIKGDVKSCILDSEAVAWDAENETILPFQVLSTRKRKDANESEIKVQVQLFAFDLIYLNGEALVKEPFLRRRQLLQENFQEIKGQFMFATKLDTDSMEEVQEFLEESIKGNCEGLMVKTLDVNASYELAKRSQKWLKLKKDYLDSGGDSLDLVVIGGFFGKGKRTGNYGGYLLACYNPEEEVYQTICKLGTGFSDEQLAQHSETLKPHIIPSAKSYYSYHQQLTPDHWFDAVQVWEVKCADLSLSPVHMAAAGIADPLRGISLRFPRFLRIRDDKGAEDATSSSQVADLYRNQEQVKNSTQAPKDDEDDFY